MTETHVTPDMIIGEVVMQYPVAAEVMLSYGLHCVGCHVNGMETIGQGAMGHGMDEDDVADMVKEINEAISNVEDRLQSDDPLIITERAAKKIAEFAKAEENQDGLFLRVSVIPGGCSGFRYGLDFDREAKDTDTIIKTSTYDVRIDTDSVQFMKGAVIDFVDSLQGSGFKIDNPNAQASCGCGKSFS